MHGAYLQALPSLGGWVPGPYMETVLKVQTGTMMTVTKAPETKRQKPVCSRWKH